MMQLNLVEEDLLVRVRMFGYCDSDFASAQRCLVDPLAVDPGSTALLFNHCSVLRAKELLPAHVQAFCEIAHVHDPFPGKTIAQIFGQQLIHAAAIDDGSLSSLCRRLHAEEPDLHGPTMQM